MVSVLGAEVLVGVAHVLRGIDHEVLLSSILDIEHVGLNAVAVFPEVSGNCWAVHGSGVGVHESLGNESDTEGGENLPAESPLSHDRVFGNELKSEPETSEESHAVVSSLLLVEGSKSISIGVSHVVREEVSSSGRGVEAVEPVHTVILDEVLSEPWSSGELGNLVEVSQTK